MLSTSSNLPGGQTSRTDSCVPKHTPFCLVLLPMRFTQPARSTRPLVRSYRTLSPLPRKPKLHFAITLRRSTLCCTCSVLADGGRYPPSCPVEPGLSSPFKERSEHLAICRQMHPTLANAKFHQRLNACNQTHEVSLRFTNNASINRPTVLRFAGFPDRTASTARTTPVVQCSALSAPRS